MEVEIGDRYQLHAELTYSLNAHPVLVLEVKPRDMQKQNWIQSSFQKAANPDLKDTPHRKKAREMENWAIFPLPP